MRLIKHLSRFLTLTALLIVSACSTSMHQRQAYCGEYPVEKLKTVQPQYLATQQGKIEYYRFGNGGSPIVLISGYSTDVTSWNREFLAALAERHDVIVFNNRQVGGSQVQSSHYDSRDLAQDTHQLIHGLNLQKPTVLGISMGGMVAQQLAVLHPRDMGHLVLINTAIAGNQSVQPSQAVEKTLLNMPNAKLSRYLLALNLFFPRDAKAKMAISLATDRFLPEHYTEIDSAAVTPLQKQLILSWLQDNPTATQLAHLQVPVLILNGRADEVIPPANSDILKRVIPQSKLMTWQDGGHAMIYQYPLEIARAVNNNVG